MEINEKTGQTVLIRHTARPGKRSNQPTVYTQMALFIPVFPLLFLSKSRRSIPFPAFGSSPKHPIINLVQSQNALPLCPIMSPIPLGSDSPLVCKLVCLLLSPKFCSPLPAFGPLCSSGLVMDLRLVYGSGDGPGTIWDRVLFGVPHLPLSLCPPLWKYR